MNDTPSSKSKHEPAVRADAYEAPDVAPVDPVIVASDGGADDVAEAAAKKLEDKLSSGGVGPVSDAPAATKKKVRRALNTETTPHVVRRKASDTSTKSTSKPKKKEKTMATKAIDSKTTDNAAAEKKVAANAKSANDKAAARTKAAADKTANTVKGAADKAGNKLEGFAAKAQDQVKSATDRTVNTAKDLVEFNRENVETLIESGKIAARGAGDIGRTNVKYTRENFVELSRALQSMFSVASPTDLLAKQTDYLRTGMDRLIDQTKHNAEAVVSVAGDAYQPIAARMNEIQKDLKKAA